MDEPVCPVTQEVCRTHWCHNSFDCAQYHSYQAFGLIENGRNDSVEAMDSAAMRVVEGVEVG